MFDSMCASFVTFVMFVFSSFFSRVRVIILLLLTIDVLKVIVHRVITNWSQTCGVNAIFVVGSGSNYQCLALAGRRVINLPSQFGQRQVKPSNAAASSPGPM